MFKFVKRQLSLF